MFAGGASSAGAVIQVIARHEHVNVGFEIPWSRGTHSLRPARFTSLPPRKQSVVPLTAVALCDTPSALEFRF